MPSRSADIDYDAALRKEFPSLTEENYVEAENICRETGLTARELFCKWEAYAMSKKQGTEPPTAADLRSLRHHIGRTARGRTVKNETSILHPAPVMAPKIDVNSFFTYADAELLGRDAEEEKEEEEEPAVMDTGDTPVQRRPRTKARTSGEGGVKREAVEADQEPLIRSALNFTDESGMELPGDELEESSFSQRQNVGRVECSVGEDRKGARGLSGVSVELCQRYLVKQGLDIRYMNDDIRGKTEIAREHLKLLGARVVARVKASLPDGASLPPSPPGLFTTPSSDTVLAVGRVRVELGEGDGSVVGRINEKSVVLENEDGHLMRLDLSRVKAKAVFLHPGMVVAAEGVNTNGRTFEVSEIYDNAIPLDDAVGSGGEAKSEVKVEGVVKKEEVVESEAMDVTPDEGDSKADSPNVRMIVACGPYTTAKNLKYEPLDELAGVVARERPDVLVLLGPFVDVDHKLVNEDLSVPYDKLFEDRVMRRVEKIADAEGAPQIIMIPSLNDIHHDHVVPQPPLAPERNLPVNIMLASNPSVIRVGNVKIGMSSLSSLLDISADCLCWNKGDRFTAIVSCMLRQGSFYLTNPPAAHVPVDSTLAERVLLPIEEGGVGVDVLITPSKLKAFTKIAEADTIVVNPGLLTRGNGGGTYAELVLPLEGRSKMNRQTWSVQCYAAVMKI